MSGISYIYFDLGGVVIDIQKTIDDLAILTGKTSEDFEEMFETINKQASRGIIDSVQLWQEYEKALFKEKTAYASYVDFCAERFGIVKPTFDFMQEISDKYPIGIISNIEHGVYEMIIEKSFLPVIQFHSIIRSCDIGYAKPEPEIYELAEQKAGVAAAQILFIDDRSENLVVPKSRGWKTVLFQSEHPERSIMEITQLLQQ